MGAIREDEWLSEIVRLTKKNAEGRTTNELAEDIGRSGQYVQGLLKKAKDLGWLCHDKQTREAIDGRSDSANVYRIVKPDDTPAVKPPKRTRK